MHEMMENGLKLQILIARSVDGVEWLKNEGRTFARSEIKKVCSIHPDFYEACRTMDAFPGKLLADLKADIEKCTPQVIQDMFQTVNQKLNTVDPEFVQELQDDYGVDKETAQEGVESLQANIRSAASWGAKKAINKLKGKDERSSQSKTASAKAPRRAHPSYQETLASLQRKDPSRLLKLGRLDETGMHYSIDTDLGPSLKLRSQWVYDWQKQTSKMVNTTLVKK